LIVQNRISLIGGGDFFELLPEIFVQHKSAYRSQGLNMGSGLIRRRDQQDEDCYGFAVDTVIFDRLVCDPDCYNKFFDGIAFAVRDGYSGACSGALYSFTY
jgi:hypothetical protein